MPLKSEADWTYQSTAVVATALKLSSELARLDVVMDTPLIFLYEQKCCVRQGGRSQKRHKAVSARSDLGTYHQAQFALTVPGMGLTRRQDC